MKLHSHTSVFFFLIINLHSLLLQATAQPPTTTTTHTSTSDTNTSNNNNNSAYYNMYTGHVYPSVAIAMLILIVAFFAAGCLAVYLGGCTDAAVASSNSSRLPLLLPITILPRGSSTTTTTHLRVAGLDAPAIDSLPTFLYSHVKELKIGKGSLECAVCLSEFRDDETLKLLPKCDHVFHPACIDPWLAARPTCPVCRTDLLAPAGDNNKNDGSINKNGDGRRSEFANLVVDEPDTPSSSSSSSDGGVFSKPDNRRCGKRLLKIVIVEIPTSRVEEQSSGSGSESESERDADQRRTVGEEEEQQQQQEGGGMLWRFTRSKSTGNDNNNNNDNSERFRLTLPEDVRREVLVRSEQLQRSKSFAALPRVSSPRSGFRSSRTSLKLGKEGGGGDNLV